MAKKSPASNKRARERAQADKTKEKEARRLERRERKSKIAPPANGEDPDLAGITAGPQPRPEWWDDAADENDENESADNKE